jgi:hypothetical protein
MADTATPTGIASGEAVGAVAVLTDALMVAHGSINLAGWCFYHTSGPLVGAGAISLGGFAWMTGVPRGADTLRAHGVIRFG